MFLVFKDNSNVADWGIELGYSNNKYIEIPDSLLANLSANFVNIFKQIMKQRKYNNFKIRKTKPSDIRELKLFHFSNMEFDISKIYIKYEHQHNLLKAYETDIEIVSKYYHMEPDTSTL